MRVAVVTGTRADYGLLRPTIGALHEDSRFDVAVLATAMHLSERHGMTISEVEADDWPRILRVPAGRVVEQPGDFARNIGGATLAFVDALGGCSPDLVLVLGDRWEILAAVLAATGLELPVAHLHGGELSEGSLDDATRHCITKLAHLHLVAADAYAQRVVQLGEEPWRVHVVGAAGLESILALEPLTREQLSETLGLAGRERPLISLTLHAASLNPDHSLDTANAVITAIDDVLAGTEGSVVLTLPNDDPGSEVIRRRLLEWSQGAPRVHAFESLGQLRYLSLLRHCDAIVGNSSSAVLEAPAFRLPAVNVGSRQQGRIQPANVISVPAEREAVGNALRRALDPAFRRSLEGMSNPYGDGNVSRRVVRVLADAPPAADLRRKRFFDLPDGPWHALLSTPGASG